MTKIHTASEERKKKYGWRYNAKKYIYNKARGKERKVSTIAAIQIHQWHKMRKPNIKMLHPSGSINVKESTASFS